MNGGLRRMVGPLLVLGVVWGETPSGRAEELPSAAIDVRDFGAKGDGAADDTEALQKAVDSGGGAIYFAKGVYRISRPIRVDLNKRGYTSIHGNGVAQLQMEGPGPALQLLGTHFRSADPGGFAEDVWKRQRMPLVDGIGIEGTHPEAVGIEAVGTMQLTVTRVHIRNVLHGIHLRENNRNVTIANCHIYENRGVGVYYDDVNLHQSNITGCHISYNAAGGIVSRSGNVRNIHISGCDIESNMSPGTPPTANVLIDCSGSPYGTGEVAITGCTIQHNNRSPESANIRILGRSEPSQNQKRVREGNVTITGNVLSDVQVNVHLRDCRGVTITGNTFWMGYTHDLLIERCSAIVVGSNNLDRNPRYAYGNTAEANNGVVIRDSEDCNISGLHITNVWRKSAGFLIENCRRFNVTNCTILDCDQRGLLAKNVEDSRISNCLIREDRPGAKSIALEVVGGRGNMVFGNLLGAEPKISEGS
ncbi:MAG: right-handed parallel beta-helix repeat-containing protein, partial [Pirellulaceae bacterium]